MTERKRTRTAPRRPAESAPQANGKPEEGRRRVVIEGVDPEIDCGRFPIKRVTGEEVEVFADIYADGHDLLRCLLRWRRDEEASWHETEMEPLINDRWRGRFVVSELGRYRYTIQAWVDRPRTWRRDLRKKVEAGQEVSVDVLLGAELARDAAKRARGAKRELLLEWADRLEADQDPSDALSDELGSLLDTYPDRRHAVEHVRELHIVVDPPRARFSTWYELFPRSAAPEPGRHGTFDDVIGRLPYVASMGFDVLYLPPIHPIGTTHRKGRNNTEVAAPEDVGSPWAIGSEEGGHKSIHPDLGTVDDFRRLVSAAADHGIDVALDLAYQCAPDHPWVKEHPEWFRHRPDGTIQYAENPPKKYQDIYPIDFESDDWPALWDELKSVVDFWIGHGVRIFRVDNPHTKAFAFWEWMIGEVKREHPDVIFLSEAFTRPRVMYGLAKLGFTQSYTYFTWRNTRWELTEYLSELTQSEVREYFRPNLWPNTPDILPEHLQWGGRPMFIARLVLAATLGASYGIYGPAFELGVNTPLEAGREEYLDSEKYEVRSWNTEDPGSLAELIGMVNRIRRENPALHQNRTLRFHQTSNDQLLCYSKTTPDHSNLILVVVNLDPHHTHSGWVDLPLDEWDIDREHPYQLHDLITEARYMWHGPTGFLELNPHSMPAHIFRLRHRMRTEHDFDYFA